MVPPYLYGIIARRMSLEFGAKALRLVDKNPPEDRLAVYEVNLLENKPCHKILLWDEIKSSEDFKLLVGIVKEAYRSNCIRLEKGLSYSSHLSGTLLSKGFLTSISLAEDFGWDSPVDIYDAALKHPEVVKYVHHLEALARRRQFKLVTTTR